MDESRTETTPQLEEERSEALASIKSAAFSPEASDDMAEQAEAAIDWKAQNEWLNFQIRLQKKKRRENWDTILSYLVIGSFVLSYLVIIMIGYGIMQFGNNAFAVPSVVGAGVLGTYGLAKLAIKYFFNDDDMNGNQ